MELYRRLDFPPTEQDITSFKSSAGLATLLQNLMNVDKSRKRKSIMDTNGANTPGSAPPSAHPATTPVPEGRRESIAASTGGHRDSIGGGGGATERPERPTKKGGPQPDRKKLTEQEEQIYGVSHHERLPSGPTFRYERINKILTTKSNAQHLRIINTLAELDIPSRLNMPTRAVVEEMEKLLNSIGVLLDNRKYNEKLDGEIRLEQVKKEERQKALGLPTPSSQGNSVGSDTAKKGEAPAESVSADSTNPAATINGESTESNAKTKTNGGEDIPTSNGTTNDTTVRKNGGQTDTNDTESSSQLKTEANEEKTVRPGSSGGHKRSASVLSALSDKSTKRLKK
jgi:DNA methyltransferase 1-associated protein 1